MKHFSTFIFPLILLSFKIFASQADTVFVNEATVIPTIDAIPDDNCWETAEWQTIDQVWIEYGDVIPSEDFTGAYKVVWSSETNLLYFLVEVTDDVFVDGWPNVAGDYYHFDIVEIFIDQDKSGGTHIFDTSTENAENAFSYHINIDLPIDGGVTTSCVVNDIAGTGWGNRIHVDYAPHFPEIALRELDGKYYWEFSLSGYDDTYDYNDPEVSRTTLMVDDIIGFSMAYCDNDGVDESPKTRDNFFGSVWVPEENFNDHWMNADGYGTLKLVSTTTDIADVPGVTTEYRLEQNYPNPFNPSTIINFSIPTAETGHATSLPTKIIVYDILGNKIKTLVNETKSSGKYSVQFDSKGGDAADLPSGVYIYTLSAGDFIQSKKMMLIK